MRSTIWGVLLAVVALAIAAIGYFYMSSRDDSHPTVVPPGATTEDAGRAASSGAIPPAILHPIEQADSGANLLPEAGPAVPPDVDGSDAVVAQALQELLSSPVLQDLFVTEGFVRRLVVIVDNLPREQVPVRRSPLRAVPGVFEVERSDDGRITAAPNAARYAPYVRLAENIDTGRFVAAYVRYYPLFQQAYEDLGYPGRYFNDRLIAAIDNLLATPHVEGPIALVQPKVLYKFADPELEKLSAGQKMMLRMGEPNAARVRAKLQELRLRLVGMKTGP